MPSAAKPTWLTDSNKLMDIINHHIFMPADIPPISNLKDEQALHSGIRQYLFWKGQLLPSVPENTIFLAFLGPEGLKPVNVLDVTRALKDICDLLQVREFYQGANTCFLALSFASQQSINQIITHFKYLDNSVVLHFSHQSTHNHRFRLLWLPPLFDINRVHHLLNKYTKTHRIRRESIAFVDNIYSPTNVISGTFTLNPGIDIASLPHLIQLPSPHRGCALLSVESRPPLCLKCREIGHTRSQCSMTKCSRCTKVHFPNSPCGVSSYSGVAARNITPCAADDWLAGISEVSLTDQPTISPSDKLLLQSTHTQLITSDDLSQHKTTSNHHLHQNNSAHITGEETECERTFVGSTISTTSVVLNHESTLLPLPESLPLQSSDSPSSSPRHTTSSVTTTTLTALEGTISKSAKNITASLIPTATFSRSKDFSKVHISDHIPPPSATARSHLITYSTATKNSASAINRIPSKSSSSFDTIFGDPDSDIYFSSDAEAGFDPSSNTAITDMMCDEFPSRKRKVSSSPPESEPSSPTDEPIFHPSDAFSSKSFSLDASSIPISKDALDTFLQSSHNPDLEPSHEQTSFRRQVSSIFAADSDQILLLEQLCPDGTFTSDSIKTFKLLFENGIFIPHILTSPYILKLRFTEIKRKISFLKKHLSVITIADICQKGRLEDKILTGASLTSSTFFT